MIAGDVLLFLFEIFDIRDDVIDARRFLFGELQADVDDHDLIFIFEEHAVAADFFEAAERHEADGFGIGFIVRIAGHQRALVPSLSSADGWRAGRGCRDRA